MEPLIIIGPILAFFFFCAGYALAEHVLGEKRKRTPRCPWEPCGYPLPKSPLYTKTGYTKTGYAAEPCPGCNNMVTWIEDGYVRWLKND